MTRTLLRRGGEVLLRPLPVGLHRLRARLPVRRADLSVLAEVLKRLQDAKRLVDRTADAEVVHGRVLDDALRVDEEEAAERHRTPFVEDAVRRREFLLEILEERVAEALDPPLLA